MVTTLNASELDSGTIPDARFPATLPAVSGANLTNLPSDTPADTDVQVTWTVTANGSSAYRFTGPGNDGTEDNPTLYLVRGQRYRFINNSGGSHPFQIRFNDGGTAYTDGVTYPGGASMLHQVILILMFNTMHLIFYSINAPVTVVWLVESLY